MIYRCFLLLFLLNSCIVQAQDARTGKNSLSCMVINNQSQPVIGATAILFSSNKQVATIVTDSNGIAVFKNVSPSSCTITVSHSSYQMASTPSFNFPQSSSVQVILQPAAMTLDNVSVNAKKPLIKIAEGKTIINVGASVTNSGTTVLDVLEKSPGVTVDKNGGIALQGKAGVLVMIDDKPTYLSGADLNNLLSSMSSAQVDVIELMTSPPAKYDASGNAGIINIKTKKSKVKGFNGSLTVTPSQGKYPKENTSLVMNYRTGKYNMFLNYSFNAIKYMTDLYALRTYYDRNGNITAKLDQPTYFSGTYYNNTVKTGVDYFAGSKTTLGMVLGGTVIHRNGSGDATATWLNAANGIDSAISTYSTNDVHFKNGSINLNLRHTINKQQDIAVDVDGLMYSITSDQHFNNQLLAAGGYSDASKGSIPTTLKIFTAKADHILHWNKNTTLSSGIKTSHINTDNTAAYQNYDGNNWQEDYGKSNHFLYKENIQAVYSSIETKQKHWSMQAGLRYEYTSYNAHQLGNVLQKDSSFSRNYNSLFPSGYISYAVDSINTFTLTVGKRIDRPPFQSLNPFTYIINKYTYQTGNPYIVPQYSWNIELSHQYKELLTTTVSYSIIKNYFSQLFLTDTVTGLLYYSQGNVGHTHNLGFSAMLNVAPAHWWSFTFQALFNHKELRGFNGIVDFYSDINQLNLNMNNQFSFAQKYTGEISGFYTTKARNDLQEKLYPTGQLSLGVSRPVLKKKGTLRMSVRDIFFTNAMEGLTQFTSATEYFILHRDTRVVAVSFTYRFGKSFKTIKRSSGGAGDEMERVGNG
ncbi:MAG: TonB-dependent receptor [Bacteroidetes bacterium]|nr:TonB-dependent receptor [Bacteroidota bacterium]